jgi:hypothetical protein
VMSTRLMGWVFREARIFADMAFSILWGDQEGIS